MKYAFIGFTAFLFTSVAMADCPSGTQPTAADLAAISSGQVYVAPEDQNKDNCFLRGQYLFDLTLDSSKNWYLADATYIGKDSSGEIATPQSREEAATLTILPGTTIKGLSKQTGLIITRGSKIIAKGTSEAPIVFTSPKKPGERDSADWAGLMINGKAPTNRCFPFKESCAPQGEGKSGPYGGAFVDDNSGELRYVRVEYAGAILDAAGEDEINGIAFQGVGRGTNVDYIQVHRNEDDGIEFFGGTVNVRHLVLTGIKDDSLDWTDGYRGKIQYVVIEQFDDQADSGIEADNRSSNPSNMPKSFPRLSNLTIIGKVPAKKGGTGIVLRAGTGAIIQNALVVGFDKSDKGCLDIDGTQTWADAQPTGFNSDPLADETLASANNLKGLYLSHNVFACNTAYVSDEEPGSQIAALLESYIAGTHTVLAPASPLLEGWVSVAPNLLDWENAYDVNLEEDDEFFDIAGFIGAVHPDNDWTQGKWVTKDKK